MLKVLASGVRYGGSSLSRRAIQPNVTSSLTCGITCPVAYPRVLFSTSKVCERRNFEKQSHWQEYNDKVYPPLRPDEESRPAYVCHEIANIKYSPKKMWIVACLVRGLSVDEALKQLTSVKRKGGFYITRAINEAIEMAIQDHNVEFRSNLWIAESFATKGMVTKGIRRGARGRITVIRYKYSNYYIRLEEGQPPADYYCTAYKTDGAHMFEEWMSNIRKRRIINSL